MPSSAARIAKFPVVRNALVSSSSAFLVTLDRDLAGAGSRSQPREQTRSCLELGVLLRTRRAGWAFVLFTDGRAGD